MAVTRVNNRLRVTANADTFTGPLCLESIRLIAGSDPDVVTRAGTLLLGQNLAAGTLLESDTAGKWKVHAGTNKVAGILVSAVDATSADANAVAYVAGDFYADQLVFPAGANTNLLKQKLVVLFYEWSFC